MSHQNRKSFSQTRTCRVVFNVTAASAIGETICVSGNHPLLGAWEEREAIELVTTPEYYPTWYSLEPVNLPLGETITYKYFIKSGGQFSRWESAEGDRTLIPRGRDIVVNEEINTSLKTATEAGATIVHHDKEEEEKDSQSEQQQSNESTSHINLKIPSTPPRNAKSQILSPKRSPSLSASPSLLSHSGSDTSEFEELQLDGRDAVIIASVFLPVRVRRIQDSSSTIINNQDNSNNKETNHSTTNSNHKKSRSKEENMNNADTIPGYSENNIDLIENLSGEPRSTWHIEWDDAALLSRPALFSRKAADVDDHKMSYVGLIPYIQSEQLTEEDKDELSNLLEKDFRCKPIYLDVNTRSNFYEGFCHKALWKLVHNWVDIYGERTSRWWDEIEHVEQYQSFLAVNAIFAKAIVEEYSEGDMIWVNGHELSLVSSYVLRKATTANIGIFIHTPFPSSEIFRTLSKREDILRGMLNCDQIGFHSFEYARHFLTCCRRVLDLKDHVCKQGFSVVEYQGRDVRITVAHANIESRLVTSKLSEPYCKQVILQFKEKHNLKGRVVISGIDRIELMQGITNKLLGYEQFLAEHPSWVGRIVLLQYGIQCKERGLDYLKTKIEITNIVERINRRYTGSNDGGRTPVVIYIEVPSMLHFEARCALWRSTDILLVCPRREGLNLLPMEYLSSKPMFNTSSEEIDDKPGVLLLSEFCSSCRVLSGAIKFNPYHTQSVSNAINDALNLNEEEKYARWHSCYSWVQHNPASLWTERVLLDLKNSRKDPTQFSYEGMGMGPRYRMTCTRSGFTRLNNEHVINAYRKSKNRLILLDIGGTLLSQVKVDNIHMFTNAKSEEKKASSKTRETRALPSSQAMAALERLSKDVNNNTVFLISGQDNESIAPLFQSIPNLGIVTDSGYTYRWSKSKEFTTMDSHFDLSWMDTVSEIMQIYTRRTTGSYIENKKFAVLWRFGDADPQYGPLQAREMVDHLNNVLSNFSVIVIKGKGYVEVRPEGVDKGSVVKRILLFMEEENEKEKERESQTTYDITDARVKKKGPVDFILCMGDDVADERMFSELLKYQSENTIDQGNGSRNGGSTHGLRAAMIANATMKTSPRGSVGGIGMTGTELDIWRQQYRSFRKGAAKGARGEATTASTTLPTRLHLPLHSVVETKETKSNQNTPVDNKKNHSNQLNVTTLSSPPTSSSSSSLSSNDLERDLSMFTVTVGRKPSTASYYYNAPEDVVELLSSLAKTTSMKLSMGGSRGSLSNHKGAQRSASLSDLASLMQGQANSTGNNGRESSAFFWDNKSNWTSDGTSTLIPNIKTTVAQRRENTTNRLKGRLTESTSLSNLAKLVEEGGELNDELVDVGHAVAPVSAAYQTMEQYMDYDDEEAPGF